MTLYMDLDDACRRVKHFGGDADAALELLEDCRALMRRSQDRIETLTSILCEVTVPGEHVNRILDGLP